MAGCNNVVLPTLFIVVNNIVQHRYTRLQADSGSTMLNNNVGSTTLLHPVFNNLEQVIIFTCVYETKGYSKSRVAGNHHHKAKGEGHRKINNWGVPIFILIFVFCPVNTDLKQVCF